MTSMHSEFQAQINDWWCLGDTWRCTPAEALGLWSTIFFFNVWVTVITVVHAMLQNSNGTGGRNEAQTQRHTAQQSDGACSFLALLFALVVGAVLWATAGVRWVHPLQCWQLQLFGVALLVACCVGFLAVHVSMAENWSPEPEVKTQHELVTSGLFRWARHPMYAVFFWAFIGSALATLNWVIALCPFAFFGMTWLRIPTEERMLVDLFGNDYLEYRSRVPALGFPWACLDRCLRTADSGDLQGALLAGHDA